MKDKFNYTAVGVMLYHCPCCAAEWRTNKLDYCPNCEVKLLYSAGEEVYVWMQAKEELPPVPGYYAVQDMDNPYGTVTTAEYEGKEISGDGWKLKYRWLKKLTRPTVSEGEITVCCGTCQHMNDGECMCADACIDFSEHYPITAPPPQQPSDSAGGGVSDNDIMEEADKYKQGYVESVRGSAYFSFANGAKWMRSKLARPTVSEGEIRKALSKYEDIIPEFLTGIDVDAGEANNARETLFKELNSMKEWQKHVRKEGNVAYCGANIFYEWVFVDAEHGRNTEKSGSRLQMCPKCKELLNR